LAIIFLAERSNQCSSQQRRGAYQSLQICVSLGAYTVGHAFIPVLPVCALIFSIRWKTSRKIAESFHFRQGQFVEISVPGAGEAPMSIASPPSRKDSLDFTMRDAGKVTHAIHRLKVRDILYLRGPPMMMKRVARKLNEARFKDNEIIMTIERYMKCGIGKCGHCNVGEKFVCIDGPVFTYEQIKNFSQKENLL
jgi:NAD(P)H-flavin reductase